MATEMGERATEKKDGRKPNTDGFTDSEVGTQILFPFDTDVSTLGHKLGIVYDPKHSTEGFGVLGFFLPLNSFHYGCLLSHVNFLGC